MGAKGSLCQAVTTEDDYLEIDTPQKQIEKFFVKYPKIKNIAQNYLSPQTRLQLSSYPARKYIQAIYVGNVNSNSVPNTISNQRGLLLYDDGFLYYGQLKLGKRQGQGLMVNQDGDSYFGSWFSNNPNGKGKYTSIDTGMTYQGKWSNGLQQGQGIQKYQDGSSYEGQFQDGMKHGKGKLSYPDGTFYQGQFQNNCISGRGVCKGKFHNYQGQWLKGKMHGKGISTWYDQNGKILGSYVGQYKQGLKHGYGEYKWEEHKIYKGKWQQGDMSSQGVLLNYQP